MLSTYSLRTEGRPVCVFAYSSQCGANVQHDSWEARGLSNIVYNTEKAETRKIKRLRELDENFISSLLQIRPRDISRYTSLLLVFAPSLHVNVCFLPSESSMPCQRKRAAAECKRNVTLAISLTEGNSRECSFFCALSAPRASCL